MFVFLSKVLPLLIYPTGLVCWAVPIALLSLRKRPRRMAIVLFLAVGYLWLCSTIPVMYATVGSLEQQYVTAGDLPTADAIVLLGGATKPAFGPRPDVDLKDEADRVLRAAQLYLDGKAPLIIASGGRLKWATEDLPIEESEAYDMARLLQMLGVPEDRILLEPNSRNTYENAVFVNEILEAENIQQILLVTSALHMPRSMQIFRKLEVDAIAAPTDFIAVPLEFSRTPRDEFIQNVIDVMPQASTLTFTTRALKEYIGWIVYWLNGWL